MGVPCKACPWVSKDQRDIDAIAEPSVLAAAQRGTMFICHTRLGECEGVKLRVLEHK